MSIYCSVGYYSLFICYSGTMLYLLLDPEHQVIKALPYYFKLKTQKSIVNDGKFCFSGDPGLLPSSYVPMYLQNPEF